MAQEEVYATCMAEIAVAYFQWQGLRRWDAALASTAYYFAITVRRASGSVSDTSSVPPVAMPPEYGWAADPMS